MVIGGYFINGYCIIIYCWLLYVIFISIDDYYIINYFS
jgi:hypothetical protein